MANGIKAPGLGSNERFGADAVRRGNKSWSMHLLDAACVEHPGKRAHTCQNLRSMRGLNRCLHQFFGAICGGNIYAAGGICSLLDPSARYMQFLSVSIGVLKDQQSIALSVCIGFTQGMLEGRDVALRMRHQT